MTPSELGLEALMSSQPGLNISLEGLNNTIQFGTVANDTIDGSVGGGNNQIYGLEGNDVLLAGNNDILYGGLGSDILDASTGSNNQLFGGQGDDVLIGGIRSQLFGDLGDDQLFAGIDGDTLTGGPGSDQFWILNNGNFPINPSVITDFEPGVDVIGLDDPTLSFERLTLTEVNPDIVISLDGVPLTIVLGKTAAELTADNFVFASSPLSEDLITYPLFWQGIFGYTAIGEFSYDSSFEGTIVTRDQLSDLQITFFDPDGNPIQSFDYDFPLPPTSELNFNFDTTTTTILQTGNFNEPDGLDLGVEFNLETGIDFITFLQPPDFPEAVIFLEEVVVPGSDADLIGLDEGGMLTVIGLEVVQGVLAAASQQFMLPDSELRIMEAQPALWPDGCLGLPEDGAFCTLAIVPGWKVKVTDGANELVYRTNESGSLVKLDMSAS